jgi:hypothetical protein
MYEDHDVLQAVLDEARKDLKNPKDLPTKPHPGSLKIAQVLDAKYDVCLSWI